MYIRSVPNAQWLIENYTFTNTFISGCEFATSSAQVIAGGFQRSPNPSRYVPRRQHQRYERRLKREGDLEYFLRISRAHQK